MLGAWERHPGNKIARESFDKLRGGLGGSVQGCVSSGESGKGPSHLLISDYEP
jgi:hypothetical protein